MSKLRLFEDFAQYFQFIYANTDDLKRQCYQLRYRVVFDENSKKNHSATEKTSSHDLISLSANRSRMDIDQYDAHSHHILMQHKPTGRYIASVRLIEPPETNPAKLLPIEQNGTEDLWAAKIPLSKLPRRSFSEISGLAVIPDFRRREGEQHQPFSFNDSSHVNPHSKDAFREFPKIALGLYLSTFSLARLLFHDYVFADLPVDLFKKLRSLGLLFEQATPDFNSRQSRAIYYLNLETGINTSHPVYELYQHILNEIVHQMNIPAVQLNDPDAAQSA